MQPLTYTYYAEVVEVVDADTIKLNLDLGFNIIFRKQNIRIKGINSEEVFGVNASDAGKEARSFLKTYLPVGTRIVVHTEKFRKSFERYLGDIYLLDGTNIADVLVEAGHAVRVDWK